MQLRRWIALPRTATRRVVPPTLASTRRLRGTLDLDARAGRPSATTPATASTAAMTRSPTEDETDTDCGGSCTSCGLGLENVQSTATAPSGGCTDQSPNATRLCDADVQQSGERSAALRSTAPCRLVRMPSTATSSAARDGGHDLLGHLAGSAMTAASAASSAMTPCKTATKRGPIAAALADRLAPSARAAAGSRRLRLRCLRHLSLAGGLRERDLHQPVDRLPAGRLLHRLLLGHPSTCASTVRAYPELPPARPARSRGTPRPLLRPQRHLRRPLQRWDPRLAPKAPPTAARVARLAVSVSPATTTGTAGAVSAIRTTRNAVRVRAVDTDCSTGSPRTYCDTGTGDCTLLSFTSGDALLERTTPLATRAIAPKRRLLRHRLRQHRHLQGLQRHRQRRRLLAGRGRLERPGHLHGFDVRLRRHWPVPRRVQPGLRRPERLRIGPLCNVRDMRECGSDAGLLGSHADLHRRHGGVRSLNHHAGRGDAPGVPRPRLKQRTRRPRSPKRGRVAANVLVALQSGLRQRPLSRR